KDQSRVGEGSASSERSTPSVEVTRRVAIASQDRPPGDNSIGCNEMCQRPPGGIVEGEGHGVATSARAHVCCRTAGLPSVAASVASYEASAPASALVDGG